MLSGLSLLGLVRDDIGAELCVIGAWVTAVYPAQETRVRPGTQVRSLSDRKDLIRIVQMKSMEFAISTPSGRCLATVLSA